MYRPAALTGENGGPKLDEDPAAERRSFAGRALPREPCRARWKVRAHAEDDVRMERRPLRPGEPPERRAALERRTALRPVPALAGSAPGSSIRLHGLSSAPAAQRAKVAGMPCRVCGATELVDPAHLASRAQGGCDHPDCVVPLCRFPCHRAFDDGRLDLLPHLEPRYRVELAHALSHLGLIELLERLTAERWAPQLRSAA